MKYLICNVLFQSLRVPTCGVSSWILGENNSLCEVQINITFYVGMSSTYDTYKAAQVFKTETNIHI